MRKLTLLFAFLLTMFAGTQVWADNADFEQTLPDGWSLYGFTSGNEYYNGRSHNGSYSIYNSSDYGYENRTNKYIKTTKLSGDLSFWMRAYSTSSGRTGYVVLYE